MKPQTILTWQGELAIDAVAALRETLLDALNRHDEVSIDLTDVTRLDLACLQLLCAACGSASIRGKRLALRGADNPALARLLRDHGLGYRSNCLRSRKDACLWLHGEGRSA